MIFRFYTMILQRIRMGTIFAYIMVFAWRLFKGISNIHSIVLTADNTYTIDENNFKESNFVEMIKYQMNQDSLNSSEIDLGKPKSETVFENEALFKPDSKNKFIGYFQFEKMDSEWIGFHDQKKIDNQNPSSIHGIGIEDIESDPWEGFVDRKTHEFESSSVKKGILSDTVTKVIFKSPHNNAYTFDESSDKIVFRDFIVKGTLLEAFAVLKKENSGFFFFISHIILNKELSGESKSSHVLKNFKRMHHAKIKLPDGNPNEFVLYAKPIRFFDGYLFFFKNVQKINFSFNFQPINSSDFSNFQLDYFLANFKTLFENDFQECIYEEISKFSFEAIPILQANEKFAFIQQILLVSCKGYRRIYEFDKQRGFEVAKMQSLNTHISLSVYNKHYYLYLNGLRNLESLLDIFTPFDKSLRVDYANVYHYYFTNEFKNCLTMVRFNKINVIHNYVSVTIYRPFLNTIVSQFVVKLVNCPMSTFEFLDYVELSSFHIFLFLNSANITVYKVTKDRSSVDITAEATFECQFIDMIRCVEINQLIVHCEKSTIVLPFGSQVFKLEIKNNNDQNKRALSAENQKIFVFTYPAERVILNESPVRIENLLVRNIPGYDPLSVLTYNFLDNQKLDFLKEYTICKDYLMEGNFLAFDILVKSEGGMIHQSLAHHRIEKRITFEFDRIIKVYSFIFIPSSQKTDFSTILNSRLNVLFQTDDEILYLYEGLEKFNLNMMNERKIKLTNIRRVLQCIMTNSLIFQGTIAIGCQGKNGLNNYYKFNRSRKTFELINQLQDCLTANYIFSLQLYFCWKSPSNFMVYSDLRGTLKNIGDFTTNDPDPRKKNGNLLKFRYFLNYEPISDTNPLLRVDILKPRLIGEKEITFETIIRTELKPDSDTNCVFASQDNLIVLLCVNYIYVYYINFETKSIRLTKKTRMSFDDRPITLMESSNIRMYYYSNKYFRKPLSASQSDDLIVAFVGCFGLSCGVFNFNANSHLISSFNEFNYIGEKSDLLVGQVILSGFDVFPEGYIYDPSPFFSGYSVTTINAKLESNGQFVNQHSQFVYPFKQHYNLMLMDLQKHNYLVFEVIPYREISKNPVQLQSFSMAVGRKTERRLDIEMNDEFEWISKPFFSNQEYEYFYINFEQILNKKVTAITTFCSLLADNFVQAVKLTPRYLLNVLLKFDPEVSKKIENRNSKPVLNLISGTKLMFIMCDYFIFKFENLKLVKLYALSKFLYLPVSFFANYNLVSCKYRFLPKTSVVLTFCGLKNSNSGYKLVNMKSLDGSLERSPDMLSFLEHIRRSDYLSIKIKRNFIKLGKALSSDGKDRRDELYPFIIFNDNGIPFIWLQEPVIIESQTKYSKIHWIKHSGDWVVIIVTVSVVQGEASTVLFSIRAKNSAGQIYQTSYEIDNPNIYEYVIWAKSNQISTQITEKHFYFIFTIVNQFVVAIRWQRDQILYHEPEVDKKIKDNAKFKNLGKPMIAFWTIQSTHLDKLKNIRFLASKPGSLTVHSKNDHIHQINVINFESDFVSQIKTSTDCFRNIDEIPELREYFNENLFEFLRQNSSQPYINRFYVKDSVLNLRVISRIFNKNLGGFDQKSYKIVILKKDSMEQMTVFQKQILLVSKSNFESKTLTFQIESPSHLLNYHINVYEFKKHFEMDTLTTNYDYYYFTFVLSFTITVGMIYPFAQIIRNIKKA